MDITFSFTSYVLVIERGKQYSFLSHKNQAYNYSTGHSSNRTLPRIMYHISNNLAEFEIPKIVVVSDAWRRDNLSLFHYILSDEM